MKNNRFNLLLILALVIGIGLACSFDAGDTKNDLQNDSVKLPKKLDAYEIKGLKFAYYLVPKDLSREKLIKVAQAIHKLEDDTQLILVDDEEKVAEYIEYVKGISSGNVDKPMPQEWADEHIVANVQKYLNGRWVLCEGYGFVEIADLE